MACLGLNMFNSSNNHKHNGGEPSQEALDSAHLNKYIDNDYLIQKKNKYNISRKLFEILRNIRTKHGGDFEEYLILYALLLASEYNNIKVISQSPDKAIRRRPHGVNLLSISEITAIPRETVRRKAAKLVNEGSITRGADGLHYYSGNAMQDDITARILEDLPTTRGASAYDALGDALRTKGKAA